MRLSAHASAPVHRLAHEVGFGRHDSLARGQAVPRPLTSATKPSACSIALVVALTFIGVSASGSARAHRPATCHLNATPGTGPLRISQDSIGILPVTATIRRLRRVCADARDTVMSSGPPGSNEPAFPGLFIPYRGLTILALQYRADLLESDMPPDGWIVAGTNGLLPGGVPMGARWSTLWRRYGAAQVTARGVLVVRFCSLPSLLFTLDVDPTVVVTSGRVDLALIPDDAAVHHILVIGASLAGSLGNCP